MSWIKLKAGVMFKKLFRSFQSKKTRAVNAKKALNALGNLHSQVQLALQQGRNSFILLEKDVGDFNFCGGWLNDSLYLDITDTSKWRVNQRHCGRIYLRHRESLYHPVLNIQIHTCLNGNTKFYETVDSPLSLIDFIRGINTLIPDGLKSINDDSNL